MCLMSCLINWLSSDRLATLLLWVSGVACSIALVAPFWMYVHPARAYIGTGASSCGRFDVGILAECCASDKCKWIWQTGFEIDKPIDESRLVVQGLFASGYVLLLPLLVLSLTRLCCNCCKDSVNLSRTICGISFVSCCLFASTIIYFWFSLVNYTLAESITRFRTTGWVFTVCIVGACSLLLSSFFWFVQTRKKMESFDVEQQRRQVPRERRGFLRR